MPLIAPSDSATLKYRSEHPIPVLALERVLRGAGGSMEALISKLIWYLERLNVVHSPKCLELLGACKAFLKSKSLPLYEQEYSRLLRSENYWKGFMAFLRRIAGDVTVTLNQAGISEAFTAVALTELVDSITYYQKSSLAAGQNELFFQMLMNVDFFGVLDDVLPGCSHRPALQLQRRSTALSVLSSATSSLNGPFVL